jgi:N,N'-diacetyllegionaminate synthase
LILEFPNLLIGLKRKAFDILTSNKIIAEIGSVHDGSLGNALKLIEIAKLCGADAAKFQMHIPEFETTRDAPNPDFFQDEPRFDYFKRTAFSKIQWKKIANHCKEVGIEFVCSPFSTEALEVLLEIGIDAIKIASGELTNEMLLSKALSSEKPVYISTGMSNYTEIDSVMTQISASHSKERIVLMQCTSIYPCPPELVGVNLISEFQNKYDVESGFSDHTNSNSAAVISAFLGANLIEKHITFSNLMYGSDAKYAYTPDKFTGYVSEVRNAWAMRQSPVNKNDLKLFTNTRKVFQKSLTLKKSLLKGTILTKDDLVLKKPGTGLPFTKIEEVIGRRLLRNLDKDTQITIEDIF